MPTVFPLEPATCHWTWTELWFGVVAPWRKCSPAAWMFSRLTLAMLASRGKRRYGAVKPGAVPGAGVDRRAGIDRYEQMFRDRLAVIPTARRERVAQLCARRCRDRIAQLPAARASWGAA